MKTSELTGSALDWAVAKACLDDTLSIYFDEATGEPLHRDDMDAPEWKPSTNWSQGGPIIEREGITLLRLDADWEAQSNTTPLFAMDGPTPLIAAMRCFVASKLGDEVEVPAELED